jgi:hypothetical protein
VLPDPLTWSSSNDIYLLVLSLCLVLLHYPFSANVVYTRCRIFDCRFDPMQGSETFYCTNTMNHVYPEPCLKIRILQHVTVVMFSTSQNIGVTRQHRVVEARSPCKLGDLKVFHQKLAFEQRHQNFLSLSTNILPSIWT